MHSQHQLNESLENVETRDGSFNVFPESHPVTKLRALVAAKINDDGYCFVNVDEVVDIVDNELLYLNREEYREVAEDIIGLGEEIDFLKEYEEHDADFKIKSRYTNSKGPSNTLEKKWCRYPIEQTVEGYREYCRQLAAEQVDQQAQLSDFT